MFHAAGWTYPWALVFAFATQVGSRLFLILLILNRGRDRSCREPSITPSFGNIFCTPRLHTTAELRRCRSGIGVIAGSGLIIPSLFQIGIVNDPQATTLPRKVIGVVAGSAPTAHLIGEMEKKGIKPVHVYGLT
jgi:hypothetical protein